LARKSRKRYIERASTQRVTATLIIEEARKMAQWMKAAQHVIGVEFDEVLLHSMNLYRVLVDRGRKRTSTEEIHRLRGWMSYYLDRSYPEKPAQFFSLPRKPPREEILEERPYADGAVRLYRFPSGYKVRNPDFQEFFQGFEENRNSYLLHWSHGDKGRKTVLCCHGWSLGDPGQAERMFRVHKLYGLGLDVALFVTPFHWKRASGLAQRFSPPFPFQHPVLGLEGFGQAMADLASSFLLLRERGASDVGLIGASLGGYLASLFVSLSRMADFVTLVVPLVSFDNLRVPTRYLREGRKKREEREALGEEIASMWRIHSPLAHTCKLPPERCLIIASKGDRLCPFEDVQKLFEHWKQPEKMFLHGGHALFFPRKARGDAWYGFLRKNKFI